MGHQWFLLKIVLVLSAVGLIFFIAVGTVLCFGFVTQQS